MNLLASITGNSVTDWLRCTYINDNSNLPGETVELCTWTEILAPFIPSPSTGEARSALRPRSGARQGQGEGAKDEPELTVVKAMA